MFVCLVVTLTFRVCVFLEARMRSFERHFNLFWLTRWKLLSVSVQHTDAACHRDIVWKTYKRRTKKSALPPWFNMVFWVACGGLSLLTILWILWSISDKAVSPQLCYIQSPLNCSILRHCPVLQSPYASVYLLYFTARHCMIYDLQNISIRLQESISRTLFRFLFYDKVAHVPAAFSVVLLLNLLGSWIPIVINTSLLKLRWHVRHIMGHWIPLAQNVTSLSLLPSVDAPVMGSCRGYVWNDFEIIWVLCFICNHIWNRLTTISAADIISILIQPDWTMLKNIHELR